MPDAPGPPTSALMGAVENEHHRRAAGVRALLDGLAGIRPKQILREIPFSWPRCVISIAAYALILSEIIRSGTAIGDMRAFTTIEPDTFVDFGPYAYPVERLTWSNASDDAASGSSSTIPYWIYKYDTTSIAMRAVAQVLALEAWPPCVTSANKCYDESWGLPRDVVFEMLDALVDGVAAHRSGPASAQGRLRAQGRILWCDRLYHGILPWFFRRFNFRTIQALHYPDAALQRPRFSFCGQITGRDYEPFFCAETWAQYHRICDPKGEEFQECSHVRDIWSHALLRNDNLRALYPNHSVDLLLVEAMENSPFTSVVYHGFKCPDLVAIFRVRHCTGAAGAGTCSTILVDDYRYESQLQTATTGDWFRIISIFRIVGQGYAWLRLLLLAAGCHAMLAARGTEDGLGRRLWSTFQVVLLIPSQVVVYGGPLPIFCYVVAHSLDSAISYWRITQKLTTIFGMFDLDAFSVLQICAVSMRSVWVAAAAAHVVVALGSRRSWAPRHGAPGVREFALTAIASLTVFAQIRVLSWRMAAVVEVHEVLPSRRHSHVRNFTHERGGGDFLRRLLLGTTVDPQCLGASFAACCVVVGAVALANAGLPRLVPFRLWLLGRTPVPHGAGTLWPVSAMVVNWQGTVLESSSSSASRRARPRRQSRRRTSSAAVAPQEPLEQLRLRISIGSGDLGAVGQQQQQQQQQPSPQRDRTRRLALPGADAVTILMNLAAMTDPVTLWRLRRRGRHLVGLYRPRADRSKTRSTSSSLSWSSSLLLLPWALRTTDADVAIDWDELELLVALDLSDLRWHQWVQCC